MRIKALFIAVPGIFAVTLLTLSLLAAGKDQRAVVEFRDNLNAKGVILKAGKYLVVHQEHVASEAGKACLFFYHPPTRSSKNEVAKFHCRIVSGEPTEGFSARTLRQPDGTYALQTLQFPGSREIHELEAAD
ncbi:MAG: hypothetical protein HYS38_01840 [Acidobacteria bacterium]|nr:hypothetical protein [Acidobacteriota bacterium]